MRTERATHKGTAVIKLIFDYDAALVARVKTIPGARWSRTMRCWHVPDTPQSVAALVQLGIDVPATEQVKNTIVENIEKKEPVVAAHPEKYNEWLTRFSRYMKERRYSERTIEHYTERLRIFFRFCRKDVLEITNEDVDHFNRNYILAKKLSATYQTQFVSAIKLFYEKIPHKRLDIALLERPRRGKALPKVLSKDEIAKIIACTANLKHRAMLSLLYSCGLRRNEILDMRIKDIDSKRGVINIRHAKGDKDRQVPLSLKILELLREYFKQYHPVTWLFEGEKPNTPYTGESLHRVFAAAKQRAGVTGPFSLHCLRHSYATHLMEAGVNLRYIQELLGHRHIKTTAIYTHVSSESIKKIKSPFDSLDL